MKLSKAVKGLSSGGPFSAELYTTINFAQLCPYLDFRVMQPWAQRVLDEPLMAHGCLSLEFGKILTLGVRPKSFLTNAQMWQK